MSQATIRGRWIPPAPAAPFKAVIEFFGRSGVWLRIGLFLVATTMLYVIMYGWIPSFPYRTRLAPLRNLHARTTFLAIDSDATISARNLAREKFANYYRNKPQPLDEVRQALIDDLFQIKQKSYAELKKNNLWSRFLTIDPETSQPIPGTDSQKELEKFKTALARDETLSSVARSLENTFVSLRRFGLLRNLEHELGDGSMREIQVYLSDPDDSIRVDVSEVRLAEALDRLKIDLAQEFGNHPQTIGEPAVVAERIFNWLKPRLPITLDWDEENSKRGQRAAASIVENRYKEYLPGDPLERKNARGVDEPVIRAFEPFDVDDIALLRVEHDAYVASRTVNQKLARTVAFYGLFMAVGALVAGYLYYRDVNLLRDLRQFSTLLFLPVITLAVAWWLSKDTSWRAEIIPMVMLAIMLAIAWRIELAIFLSAMVALIYSVCHGYGLDELVILTAATSTASLLCGSIRSRTKLVYVGVIVAAVVFPTVIGVQYLLGQPMGRGLLLDASWFAGSAALAGLFMTALLPFLEWWFDIQTDISLLEISDASHPLLKELVQRAPGTYNHSINVGSISEAAAVAIGANGLLCRVGAYFHDIGKIRKP